MIELTLINNSFYYFNYIQNLDYYFKCIHLHSLFYSFNLKNKDHEKFSTNNDVEPIAIKFELSKRGHSRS